MALWTIYGLYIPILFYTNMKSEKQCSIALSSTETEYMALSSTCTEAISLRRLILQIRCGESKKSRVLHTDNLSAQQLEKNPVHHSTSKHIDFRYHFVRDVCG